ncbi:hypothetical protein JW949_04075, partial [Candidatus Woesearchaeota archaeon]|nr:hypothetical protein [Candidatus Woesearchaeota archaeon]
LDKALFFESSGKKEKAKEKFNNIFKKNKNRFTFILKNKPFILFYQIKYSSKKEAKNLLNYFSKKCKDKDLEDIIVTLFVEYCAWYSEENGNIETALFFYDKVIDGYNDEGLFIDSINTAYNAMKISEKDKDKKKFRRKLKESIDKYDKKENNKERRLDMSRKYNELTRVTGIRSFFSVAQNTIPSKHYTSSLIPYIKNELSKKSAMED